MKQILLQSTREYENMMKTLLAEVELGVSAGADIFAEIDAILDQIE